MAPVPVATEPTMDDWVKIIEEQDEPIPPELLEFIRFKDGLPEPLLSL
jgi:hypothetical protein